MWTRSGNMNIKKWTGSKTIKVDLDKLKRIYKHYKHNGVNSLIKGGINMAVSKACISCLDAEATKIFKEDLAKATLSLDVIKKGQELLKKLTQNMKEK